MPKAISSDTARAALAWANVSPPIPYVPNGSTRKGADCQGLVEGCIKDAGGKANYAGSNAMFRTCRRVGSLWTLKQAQSDGKLVPGALVFILERDGKEPARYKADGLGNASHVGIYVGQSDVIWSVDASSSAGRVRTRTKRDAPHVWTHVGYLPEIDYTTRTPTQPTVARPIPTVSPNSVVTTNINPYSIPAFIPYDAVVLESGAGRVRVRKAPAGEYHGHISTGQIVNVIDEVPDWSKLRWKTGTYWMMSKYLAKR